MVETIGRLSDGSLEMMALTGDGAERKLFSSKNNGGSWEEIALPKELDAANCPFTYAAAISADGRALCLLMAVAAETTDTTEAVRQAMRDLSGFVW